MRDPHIPTLQHAFWPCARRPTVFANFGEHGNFPRQPLPRQALIAVFHTTAVPLQALQRRNADCGMPLESQGFGLVWGDETIETIGGSGVRDQAPETGGVATRSWVVWFVPGEGAGDVSRLLQLLRP